MEQNTNSAAPASADPHPERLDPAAEPPAPVADRTDRTDRGQRTCSASKSKRPTRAQRLRRKAQAASASELYKPVGPLFPDQNGHAPKAEAVLLCLRAHIDHLRVLAQVGKEGEAKLHLHTEAGRTAAMARLPKRQRSWPTDPWMWQHCGSVIRELVPETRSRTGPSEAASDGQEATGHLASSRRLMSWLQQRSEPTGSGAMEGAAGKDRFPGADAALLPLLDAWIDPELWNE